MTQDLISRVLNRPVPLHDRLALIAALRTDLSAEDHNTIIEAAMMLRAYLEAEKPK